MFSTCRAAFFFLPPYSPVCCQSPLAAVSHNTTTTGLKENRAGRSSEELGAKLQDGLSLSLSEDLPASLWLCIYIQVFCVSIRLQKKLFISTLQHVTPHSPVKSLLDMRILS